MQKNQERKLIYCVLIHLLKMKQNTYTSSYVQNVTEAFKRNILRLYTSRRDAASGFLRVQMSIFLYRATRASPYYSKRMHDA